MTHEELFINARLYAPSPLANVDPRIEKTRYVSICYLLIHLEIA